MNSPQAGHGSNDFEVLCAQYLDGSLDESGRDRLAELLESDPAAIEALRAQLLVSGAGLRLLGRGRNDGDPTCLPAAQGGEPAQDRDVAKLLLGAAYRHDESSLLLLHLGLLRVVRVGGR